MSKVQNITKEQWLLSTFPEWGTWLNEEIEETQVPEGNFAMWWLGCTGIWLKSHEGTNILCDLWCGSGKRTKKNKLMKDGHQMQRMSGCKQLQPNLRTQPFVIDPFEIKNVDALVVTHIHSDHLDINTAAAVLKNTDDSVPFIGPKAVVDVWKEWGVPESRCIIVKPGDNVNVGSVEIIALEAFDRTALITVPQEEELNGQFPQNMDDIAVNYLFKTSGGNLYHAGDSHFSVNFAKHGNEHTIDVALGAFGENPRGITDKLTSVDLLRMAECLNTKVVIPVHHDIWSNFQANPQEILELWKNKKDFLDYDFAPFIWQVGGQYTYPQDRHKFEYHYPRGFEDVFTVDNDLPYPSFL
ncbi:L-ascorbate 6-phosphate lactonase [Staphylococcus durrellii]|uniref:L-ascorbate 6-phosphate lactonase n=1 Tax=Staphylococcus durrellii TaxID=2781773 RepID=UPI00189FA7DC|nr:L-ascorbate 6-phosphate lactonase [Staphylococcus durrellii]MBF7017977.1 L-ascorbate 6-phosphate lactonase [Staphylococcus durrellii]